MPCTSGFPTMRGAVPAERVQRAHRPGKWGSPGGKLETPRELEALAPHTSFFLSIGGEESTREPLKAIGLYNFSTLNQPSTLNRAGLRGRGSRSDRFGCGGVELLVLPRVRPPPFDPNRPADPARTTQTPVAARRIGRGRHGRRSRSRPQLLRGGHRRILHGGSDDRRRAVRGSARSGSVRRGVGLLFCGVSQKTHKNIPADPIRANLICWAQSIANAKVVTK